MSTTTKKRNYLPLKKKMEVIMMFEVHKMNQTALAEHFHCERTQIANIIKNKESIRLLYESNASESKVHSIKVSRVSEFEEVNTAFISGTLMLAQKKISRWPRAKQIAQRLGRSNFKGVCGKSGDVQGSTVDSWKERLPEIVAAYKKENIWNMDESGVFWRALPDKGFGEKGKRCVGGKKYKQRLTVILLRLFL